MIVLKNSRLRFWDRILSISLLAGRYVSRKSVMVDVAGQKRESLLHTMELVADCVLPGPMTESGQFPKTYRRGDRLQFWGSTELDQLLSRVPQNGVVRITYQGRQQLSGNRTLKKWEVRLAKPAELDDAPYELGPDG